MVENNDIDFFLKYVTATKNIDLSFYRKTFLMRRLRIRMTAVKAQDIRQYIEVVKRDPGEWNAFIDQLSVNVSQFFRDKEVFEEFRKLVIPQLIHFKREASAVSIRCWSCGCSNGEEPYSLAILFTEALNEWNEKMSLRITASDVDADALETAKKGEFGVSSMVNVRPYFMKLYFDQAGPERYRVKDEIRQKVVFKKHNLFIDRPFSFMDVVFFRNVGIYLSPQNTEKVFQSLHASLRKDGYLVLGKVESLRHSMREFFQPVSLTNKIYKKVR